MTFRTMAKEKREASRAKVVRAKVGETVLWCENCARFVRIDEETYDGRCPECKGQIFKMKCTRCSNEWYPRSPIALPGTCPHCKSPYYNKTRVRTVGGTKAQARMTVPADGLTKVIERMEADE